MDVLLSWNFKHLANINKEQKVLGLNKIGSSIQCRSEERRVGTEC
jgi:hypothetical protein